MNKIITYTVDREDEGLTLGQILKNRLGLTVREIRSVKFDPEGMLINGERYLEGRFITTNTIPPTGSEIRVCFRDEEPTVVPVEKKLDILYEDEDLVFIHKPSGMTAHPAGGHFTDTLANYLAAYLKSPARMIGRLDKETSGVIGAAKSSPALAKIETQRKTGDLRREYLAIVHGEICGEGVIGVPLRRMKSKERLGKNGKELSLMEACRIEDEGALPSGTQWQALRSFEKEYTDEKGGKMTEWFTLVRLHLLTGRTHQIRAHMSYIGHPLVGDGLYGPLTKIDEEAGRCFLHSECVKFIQPFTGERHEVKAPLPEDMRRFLPWS